MLLTISTNHVKSIPADVEVGWTSAHSNEIRLKENDRSPHEKREKMDAAIRVEMSALRVTRR